VCALRSPPHNACVSFQRFSDRGQPLAAAALHLAIADPQRALHKLLRGNEIELAYVACVVLKLHHVTDAVYTRMALRCERYDGCRMQTLRKHASESVSEGVIEGGSE
jgi:hypothetical protein